MIKRLSLFAAATMTVALAACGSSNAGKNGDSSKAASSSIAGGADLTGAGATFPQPIYTRWISEVQAKTGLKVNYQAIGSGGGIKQLQEQTVDFGATDVPMSDSDMAKAKGGPIYHIPTVVGVVAIAYNLPGV